MLTAALATLALLPLYLWLRHPFNRLPLHIDTGFYVSNHTVATRKLRFSRGWNARFAGCSKVLPEIFYSLVYLAATHRQAAITRRRHGYKTWSRIAASLYNYVTCVAGGLLGYQLFDGNIAYYYAGLIAFALVSSEAQYGVYFENGELFSVLWNVAAIGLLAAGVTDESGSLIALGVFLWACDAYFIKLSSGIALAVVALGVVIAAPQTLPPASLGGATATAAYLLWVRLNGHNPSALLRSLWGHEAALGQRRDFRIIQQRIGEKLRCLARTILRQPILPALALVGLALHPNHHFLVWLWLAGVTAAYLIQAADCWYYQIPFLPLIALFAASAVADVAAAGVVGYLALVPIGVIWLSQNTLRARRMDAAALNAWCWRGYHPPSEAAANLELDDFTREIGPIVRGHGLLVYGPFNQAYALLHASYDTPILAPEHYMDDMCPGWQAELNRRLVSAPPSYILDTADCFAAATASSRLGLDYRCIPRGGGRFRLYALQRVLAPAEGFESARTFEPQWCNAIERPSDPPAGPESWETAAARSDDPAGAGSPDPADPAGVPAFSEESAVLAQVLSELHGQGIRRIAIYGAGRYTLRNRRVYHRSGLTVAAVLDDNPERIGQDNFLGLPLCRPEEAHCHAFEAVVISTDRFTRTLAARANQLWGDALPIVSATHPRTEQSPIPPSAPIAAGR